MCKLKQVGFWILYDDFFQILQTERQNTQEKRFYEFHKEISRTMTQVDEIRTIENTFGVLVVFSDSSFLEQHHFSRFFFDKNGCLNAHFE